jgi:hypothetical protein
MIFRAVELGRLPEHEPTVPSSVRKMLKQSRNQSHKSNDASPQANQCLNIHHWPSYVIIAFTGSWSPAHAAQSASPGLAERCYHIIGLQLPSLAQPISPSKSPHTPLATRLLPQAPGSRVANREAEVLGGGQGARLDICRRVAITRGICHT